MSGQQGDDDLLDIEGPLPNGVFPYTDLRRRSALRP